MSTDDARPDLENSMSDDDAGHESISHDSSPYLPAPAIEFRGDPTPDFRLYVPDHEDWDVKIKRDSERIYCYSKSPGQDYFHLILGGEIYVTRQHERYCLECALRMGFLTQDRLFWQHRVPKRPNQTL